MTKRAMVMDIDRCTGCMGCIVSCKFENSIGLGNYWCDVFEMGPYGIHPDIEMYRVPFQCQQCENAPCVEACPVNASYRDPDNNVVLIDKDSCIGCKTCLSACPFSDPKGIARPSARWYNEIENVVEKCTLCNHLTLTSDGVENSEDTTDPDHAVPPCVHNCCNKARHFGDLDDPDSEASQYLAQAIAEGRETYSFSTDEAQASFVYVFSKEHEWHGFEEAKVLKAQS